jgi:cytochrome P450
MSARAVPKSETQRLSVPGPPRLLGGLGNAARYVRDPVGHLSLLFRRYGPVVALARGGGTRVVSPFPHCPGSVFVYGPELVRKVKTPHASWEIPPLTGNLYPLGDVSPRRAPLKRFATGLWGVQGDEHREHRKLLLPAFHRDQIAGYRDEIVALTSRTFEHWRPGDTLDLHEELLGLTARVATTILFGEDGEAGGDEHGPEQTAERIWELVASPFTQLAPYDLPGLPYRRFIDLVTTWDNQMRNIIRRKRSSAATHHADVLSSLISSTDAAGGAALTEDELIGHVGSIFGAAHETTASALTWTVFLLAQHPAVSADLVDEVDGRLKGDPPRFDQLSDMPLLDHVVKESLRIIPPVPVTWRIAAQQVELGGHAIPRGAEVYASTYHTHHMRELYSEAESFEPRRWEHLDPSTYEYIPFGAGPRRCMGDLFAMVEMKIVLSMLLQRFSVQLPARIRVDRIGFPVIRPRRGLPVMVRSLDRRFDTSVSVIGGNVREMVRLP